jgi:hypothetical protein
MYCLRRQHNMPFCMGFDGSDGTRTRDLRRDRCAKAFQRASPSRRIREFNPSSSDSTDPAFRRVAPGRFQRVSRAFTGRALVDIELYATTGRSEKVHYRVKEAGLRGAHQSHQLTARALTPGRYAAYRS